MDVTSPPTSSARKGAPKQRRQARHDASGLSRSDDTADTRNAQRFVEVLGARFVELLDAVCAEPNTQ
jgi:hypothetical protein